MTNIEKRKEYGVGNDYMGRPHLFKSPEELHSKIQDYFQECDTRSIEVYDKKQQAVIEIKEPMPYTVEGLADHLGTNRTTLLNYKSTKGYEDFFNTMKKAIAKIQRSKIERGLLGDFNPAVTIFLLKNNFGYVDKQEIEQKIEHKVEGFQYIVPKDLTKQIDND